MNRLAHWIAFKRYRWALFWHLVRDPTPLGHPGLGHTREERDKNLRIMWDRWRAKGPRPEDYGLPPDGER